MGLENNENNDNDENNNNVANNIDNKIKVCNMIKKKNLKIYIFKQLMLKNNDLNGYICPKTIYPKLKLKEFKGTELNKLENMKKYVAKNNNKGLKIIGNQIGFPDVGVVTNKIPEKYKCEVFVVGFYKIDNGDVTYSIYYEEEGTCKHIIIYDI